jgi:hypothetical protein
MTNPTTPFSWQMPISTDLVTDLPADFEVFGQAVATSMADLLGGTTGQVLAKASNTNMDFTWVTTDDANAIQNSIVDAKGDLIAATANDTPARLAVGANDYFLQAASGESTGLKWGGAWTTYTPTAAAQSGTITSYTSVGSYIKIGKMVAFNARIALTNAGTGGLSLQISVPLTAKTGDIFTFSGQETATTGKGLTGSLGAATNDYDRAWVRFYDWTTAIATSNTIQITGIYEVA